MAKQKFGSRFLLHLCPLNNSATTSTMTTHCQLEDETARERIVHPPSNAKAKKMKSLTLHAHGLAQGIDLLLQMTTLSLILKLPTLTTLIWTLTNPDDANFIKK